MAQVTYKMALITTLAQNISRARTDDARLRAINNFLGIYNKNVEKQEVEQPIPFCDSQDQANSLVNEGRIPANSLFIDGDNSEYLGVARLTGKGKKGPGDKAEAVQLK
jgi:hypothetical protein